jgi:DNA-binding response OmpR family regulator
VSEQILVVEDDPTINQAVTDRLRVEGFVVHQAYDGPTAVKAHEEHRPDLVVLDVMLPGFDGIEVCRRVQAARPVPVLMLTARDDETDLLVGLGVGADDYVTKPFRMRELVARVRALLRRVERARELAGSPSATTGLGDLRIEHGSRRVWVGAAEVHLTPLEFDLLLALATTPGVVRSRDELMREVWGWADAGGTRTLDSHVKALRAKIGPEWVRTVHGVGYAIERPDGPDGTGASGPRGDWS